MKIIIKKKINFKFWYTFIECVFRGSRTLKERNIEQVISLNRDEFLLLVSRKAFFEFFQAILKCTPRFHQQCITITNDKNKQVGLGLVSNSHQKILLSSIIIWFLSLIVVLTLECYWDWIRVWCSWWFLREKYGQRGAQREGRSWKRIEGSRHQWTKLLPQLDSSPPQAQRTSTTSRRSLSMIPPQWKPMGSFL